ncbi:hypothetical protein Hrd1104_09210 [Halorhabdus sp. CBA1104]|nr:hypothetical protein Hrd1104_09210 [Halorhabdus sp. CBA1104]
MMRPKLRRLGYAWIALHGLLSALLPKQLLNLSIRTWLSGFENPGDLEPRDWYLRAVRAAGVGMIAAGLTGIVLERDAESAPDEPSVEIDAPAESDAA